MAYTYRFTINMTEYGIRKLWLFPSVSICCIPEATLPANEYQSFKSAVIETHELIFIYIYI